MTVASHLLRAMRPKQWVKNVFVLPALVFARRLTDIDALWQMAAVFAAFSLLASAVYLINDVADIERDRQHPTKRNRPIAAGKVSPRAALALAVLLAAAGLGAGWWLSVPTGVVLTAYAVNSGLYSVWLKHVVLLDVFLVAFGFLLRVLAGAAAIGVGVSPWLLICTFFVALFLAFCKRRAELADLGGDAAAHRTALSGYVDVYVDHVLAALAGMTVMSYALYTIDASVLSRLGTDALVLTLPPFTFGVFRYLLLVHAHGLGGSPTEVVLSDRGMQATGLLWAIIAIATIYLHVQIGLTGPGAGL